jgi:hypothetical protein
MGEVLPLSILVAVLGCTGACLRAAHAGQEEGAPISGSRWCPAQGHAIPVRVVEGVTPHLVGVTLRWPAACVPTPPPFGKVVKGIDGRHHGQTRYRVRCPPFATDLGAPQRTTLCAKRRPEQVQQRSSYSITSSARCWSIQGTSRPSALAVLRLITSSSFVGCSTGRSSGLLPLRILST